MDESKHEQCLICNGRKLERLHRYAAHHLLKCKTCGFVFAEKIPAVTELIHHYEGYTRNNYLSPVTIKRYHQLLDQFEKFRNTNRLLDVGSGIGYFLDVAKQRGWDVYGTEFTDEAVRICREKGISMQQGKLDPQQYDPASFDVITSFEVMEHINNPQEELKHFYSVLRPGGLVYVTTPNFNSLSRLVLKERWNVLAYPEHLCYYTPASIRRLFSDHGFIALKTETTGISITRAKTSMKLSDQSFISESSDDEKLRRTIESNRLLRISKIVVNRFLTMMSAGDSIKSLFIKKV
jgi:2-polyprenyl-3-methyl-5-hydroxy-6-metoxy-1,4-benzoquinol methylase